MSADLSQGFNPGMLVSVAEEQAPELPWLPAALAGLGAGNWESAAYVRYVSAANANQPGSEWQFQECVELEHQDLGDLVIDVLSGNRIGGIELIHRIQE